MTLAIDGRRPSNLRVLLIAALLTAAAALLGAAAVHTLLRLAPPTPRALLLLPFDELLVALCALALAILVPWCWATGLLALADLSRGRPGRRGCPRLLHRALLVLCLGGALGAAAAPVHAGAPVGVDGRGDPAVAALTQVDRAVVDGVHRGDAAAQRRVDPGPMVAASWESRPDPPSPARIDGLPLPERPVADPPEATPSAEPGTVGNSAARHRIRPGESLWRIAAERLPGRDDAAVLAAVQRLHADNRDVVGDDPDLIHPGRLLDLGRLPATAPPAHDTHR